jgi:photosystem II stability/assembly factor-like uncharacterized protein
MIEVGSRVRIWAILVLFLTVSVGAGIAAKLPAASDSKSTAAPAPPAMSMADAWKNLEFRNIGPAVMGGRIDDFAVVESDPDTVYAATASGGIWKTTNGGTTWTPIFEHETTSSIGAIAVAQSSPDTIWVGTGEANNRQSASWGYGVFKSTDAGKTWQHMGLEGTQAIGRIVIDPRDANTVYVAALGGLWGPNRERGVYKTTDGGKTWKQSLYINEDTGVCDIAIDLESPSTLYAAAYQRRRTVAGFNGGGPEGGIYKTTDGGATWTKLTKDLPYAEGGDVGRIGLAVYRRNPNIVYARIQHAKGGIFRSEDKGATWTKMSDTNPRPSYFGLMIVDPNNDLRVWVPGAPLYHSEDGGKTFIQTRGTRVHSDYHGFWIDPKNSEHMIVGVDGGIYFTRDAGRTWDHDNVVALGQFYEVTANNERPYKVCGGLQDNGSWCAPSQTFKAGITNDDWMNVGGGDGFYNRLDPVDANTDYAESQDGNLSRRDLRTGESKSIRPREKAGEPPYRFQWNSPIEISAFDHNTIYYAANFLFKSNNRGDSWTKISPDLTNNQDRRQMKIFGKVPDKDTLSREDGVEWWPCITVISESPVNKDVLWAGTDDGNLQVTRDGGKNWSNVAGRVPGLPKGTYVSRIVASKYAEGSALAAFDGHRNGDFRIYLYATTDYGQNWKSVSSGISDRDGTLHVVREDPKVQNILYAGTERGLFISYDRGGSWTRINMNLPTVPVDDILIHPRDNDMILGTHGRSIWILDDLTPLQQLTPQMLDADLKLFDIRPAYTYRVQTGGGGGFGNGHRSFLGPNPPYGALLNFYLKAKPGERERLTITVSDKDGKQVRQIVCGQRPPGAPGGPAGPGGGGQAGGAAQAAPAAAEPSPAAIAAQTGLPAAQVAALLGGGCDPKEGINRVAWNLRMDPPAPPQPGGPGGGGGGGGGGGFGGGGAQGPVVEPGTYTVTLALGEKKENKPVLVEEDPRIQITPADRAARHDAIMKGYELSGEATITQRRITALKTALDAAMAAWKRPGGARVPDNVQKAADELSKAVNEVSAKFVTPPPEGGLLGNAGPPLVYTPPTLPQRIGQVYGGLQGITQAPTPEELESLSALAKELAELQPKVEKLVTQDLSALNKLMNDAGVPHIVVAGGPGGGRRRQ